MQGIQKLSKWVNLFHATGLFLYPLLTSENLHLSNIFRWYRKTPMTECGWSISKWISKRTERKIDFSRLIWNDLYSYFWLLLCQIHNALQLFANFFSFLSFFCQPYVRLQNCILASLIVKSSKPYIAYHYFEAKYQRNVILTCKFGISAITLYICGKYLV